MCVRVHACVCMYCTYVDMFMYADSYYYCSSYVRCHIDLCSMQSYIWKYCQGSVAGKETHYSHIAQRLITYTYAVFVRMCVLTYVRTVRTCLCVCARACYVDISLTPLCGWPAQCLPICVGTP